MSLRDRLGPFFIAAFVLTSNLSWATSSPTLDEIKKYNELNVCIWPEYFSITYQNPRTNALEGIDIELSQALAEDLGVRLNYVQTHFGRFTKDLKAGACDVAMFGVGNTAARREHVDFTQPYLASNMYAITANSHPFIRSWKDMDQKGVIVCVQKGTYMENAMRQNLKHATITTVLKPNEREIEVLSGRADVFITDYPYGQKMLHLYDWANLLAPTGDTEKFNYAYAVAKGDPAWLKRVDQFVSDIKQDGRLKKAAAEYGLTPIVLTQ